MKTESPAGAQSTLDVHRRLGGSMLVDDHSADDKHHMCELLDPDQARHTYSSTTVQHQHQQYPAPVHMHTHGGAYERPRWRPSGAVTAPTDGTPTAAAATPATVSTVYERLRAAYLPVLKQESVPSLRYEHGSASYLQYDEHTHARSERSEPHHDYHQHLHSQHLSSREAHSYENGQATVYSYTDRHDLQHQQSHERPAEAEAVTYRHSQYDQYDVSPAPVSASAPAVEYRPRPRWSARSTLTAIDALDEHRTLVPASAPVPAYAALSHPPPHANAYAPQDHRWPAEQYASNSQAPPVHVLPVSASYAPPTSTDRLSHHQHYHHASSPSAPVSHGENIPSSLLKPVPQYHERAPSPQQQRHERTRSPPPQRHERTRSPPPQRHERTRSPPTQRHERSRSPPTQHREQASSLSRYEDSNSHYQQRTRSPPRHYAHDDGDELDNDARVVVRHGRYKRSRSPSPLNPRRAATSGAKTSSNQITPTSSTQSVVYRAAKIFDGADSDDDNVLGTASFAKLLVDLTPEMYDDKELHSDMRHTAYMLVPSEAFGCIVGAAGATVLRINARSQCLLSMREADALALEDDDYRVLRIYGKPKGICLAQHLVIERIRAQRARRRDPLYTPVTLRSNGGVLLPLVDDGLSGPLAASSKELTPSTGIIGTLRWLVPSQRVGPLIGPRGVTVVNIARETNTMIHITPTTEMPRGSKERRVTITGASPAHVEAARAKVETIAGGRAEPAQGARGKCGQYFAIPWRCAGALIGARGATIQQIAKQSGARLQLSPPDVLPLGSLNKTLHIQGTAQQIEDAYELVRSLLHDDLARIGDVHDVCDVDVTLKLVVSARVSRMLLDNRGRLAREIADKSGGFMRFLPPLEVDARVCEISGSLECALRAQRVLLQCIAADAVAAGRSKGSDAPDDLRELDLPVVTQAHRPKVMRVKTPSDDARGKDAGSRGNHHTRTHTDAAQRGRVRERNPSSRGDRDWRRSASSDDRRVRVVSRENDRPPKGVVKAPESRKISMSRSLESRTRSASRDGGRDPPSNIIDRLGAPLMSARPSNAAKKQRR